MSGIAEQDVRVDVDGPLDFLDDLADLLGQFAELGQLGAEDLDLDRALDPRQVVDLVLDQRDKLRL